MRTSATANPNFLSAVGWWLLWLPLLLGYAVQSRVKSVFDRYRAVANHARVSGAEVARALLNAHGLYAVPIELVPGWLTDYYDGEEQTLHLSEAVARERSVSAAGIAGHEASHAYQDAEGDRAYRLRKSIGEPLARFAPWSGVVLIGGFWFGVPILMALSLTYITALALFAAVTLPVEIGASHRAVEVLQNVGLADDQEAKDIRKVLRAAALTYVVDALYKVGLLLGVLFVTVVANRLAT